MNWDGSQASLIISAASPVQFPETDVSEIVLAGKSNVGKSSLINALINRKSLAYVGNRPGKTRLVNFYHINDQLMLVDVPGYGYANRSKKEQEQYGVLMDHYFSYRKQAKAVLICVDVRRGIGKDDLLMMEVAKNRQLPFVVILTKVDKVSHSLLTTTTRAIKAEHNVMVVPFSALKKTGIEAIQSLIDGWIHS